MHMKHGKVSSISSEESSASNDEWSSACWSNCN